MPSFAIPSGRTTPSGGITFAFMRSSQSFGKLFPHPRKVALNSASAANQYVIVIRQTRIRERCAQQFTKPPLHSIAHHCIANLLCDGDPITNALAAIWPGEQHKAGPRIAKPLVSGEEIRPFGYDLNHDATNTTNGPPKGARKRDCASPPLRRKPSSPDGLRAEITCAPEGASKLGAEFLTAALATGTKYVATARSRFACKETVPTGTHEIAGLKSPLHNILKSLEWRCRPKCGGGTFRYGHLDKRHDQARAVMG